MKILAIDCSTKITNIGVAVDGKVTAESNTELAKRQSAELPLLVQRALDDSRLTLKEIDLIAAGKGPGYYTGIRTGVAYAAALAEALRVNVVPLSTLEIFVYDLLGENRPLAPVLKANRGHVYGALYVPRDGNLIARIPEGFYSAEAFAQIMLEHADALLVGEDRDLYEPLSALPHDFLPRLSGTGSSAALMGARFADRAIEPSTLRGDYLRAPDIGPC